MNSARATLRTLYTFNDAEIDLIVEARNMVRDSDEDVDGFIRIFLPRMLHSHGIYGMMQDVMQVGFLLKLIEDL